MARSSGRRVAITANPAAIWATIWAAICRAAICRAAICRCGAGAGPGAEGHGDSEPAAGTARTTRVAAVSTAARAPNPAATTAARAGPARLAAL